MEMTWGQFFDAGIAGAILAALFYFIDKRFWPWYTDQYWPAKQKQELEQQQVLMGIRDAIIGIQALFNSSEETKRQTVQQLDQVAEGQIKIIGMLHNHINGKEVAPELKEKESSKV